MHSLTQQAFGHQEYWNNLQMLYHQYPDSLIDIQSEVSQSVFRGYQPKCIMIWNMHPPKLDDRKYNSLNYSDESEVVDKWWNVILNAARGHPCKGRNKMIHSLLSQSLVLFELQVEYCHSVHFLPLRRTKQMEDSFFQHQTENVHILADFTWI